MSSHIHNIDNNCELKALDKISKLILCILLYTYETYLGQMY